ncbi:MAG: outer membrane beta-barrel protein [Alphaproteobacteria bacterium]|nr:outer membrane beta-barrel protein [Alphaproteobacteria bacterium]
MKKIAVSALAVVLACPAFAGQKSDLGWDPYIAMRGGLGYNNLNYDFNKKKETAQDLDFRGRLALGLEMCNYGRSEIEWSIYSKAKDTKDFGDIKNVKIENELQTLLWNTYMEFGDYTMIRPFVGVGIGLGFTDVTRKGSAITERHEEKTRFAATGSLGMTFDWRVFAVDVSARYNYVDVRSGLHDFGGDIGVRFMF